MPAPVNPHPHPRSRLRLFKRVLAVLAILLVALLIAAYFALSSPVIIQKFVLPKVSKALNAQVTAEKGKLRPFSGLDLEGVSVKPRGEETIFRTQSLKARYHLLAILRGQMKIDELTLVNPQMEVIRRADGTSNLDRFTKKSARRRTDKPPRDKTSAATAPSKSPPKLEIGL